VLLTATNCSQKVTLKPPFSHSSFRFHFCFLYEYKSFCGSLSLVASTYFSLLLEVQGIIISFRYYKTEKWKISHVSVTQDCITLSEDQLSLLDGITSSLFSTQSYCEASVVQHGSASGEMD